MKLLIKILFIIKKSIKKEYKTDNNVSKVQI